MNGFEIDAHSDLVRQNKYDIIAFNGDMRNLENRVEKLENHENGASASDVVYFGDNVFKVYDDAMDTVNTDLGDQYLHRIWFIGKYLLFS